MAIEETFRHEFQMRVEEATDAETAHFLMAHLPPVPWPDVATKHDLEVMQMATKNDLEVMQTATKNDLEVMEARIDVRFAAVTTSVAEARADLMQMMTTQT